MNAFLKIATAATIVSSTIFPSTSNAAAVFLDRTEVHSSYPVDENVSCAPNVPGRVLAQDLANGRLTKTGVGTSAASDSTGASGTGGPCAQFCTTCRLTFSPSMTTDELIKRCREIAARTPPESYLRSLDGIGAQVLRIVPTASLPTIGANPHEMAAQMTKLAQAEGAKFTYEVREEASKNDLLDAIRADSSVIMLISNGSRPFKAPISAWITDHCWLPTRMLLSKAGIPEFLSDTLPQFAYVAVVGFEQSEDGSLTLHIRGASGTARPVLYVDLAPLWDVRKSDENASLSDILDALRIAPNTIIVQTRAEAATAP